LRPNIKQIKKDEALEKKKKNNPVRELHQK